MAVEVGNNERLKKLSFSSSTQKNYTCSFVCVLQTLKSDFAKKFYKSQNMSTCTTLLWGFNMS